MNNPNTPSYGPQNVNQPYPPHQSPQKPKWSTKKKFGVGAAIVLGIGVIGGAIGGGTSGSSDSSDKKPAVSAQVEDHANYEVEQQRTQSPATTTTPPVRTYDAYPGKPADAIDDLYVEQLNDKGIYAPRNTLIEAGRDGVCVLADGTDNFTVLMIAVMDATGFDHTDASVLIGSAFGAYCPEHGDMLDTGKRGA